MEISSKVSSLTYVLIYYNNTNMHTKYNFQNYQSYMCTYPIQQLKHKQEGSLPKCPLLHVYITSTTKQKLTQRHVVKMTSPTCVHTLYNK